MLITPSLSHCSNKYKLAREGINKERKKDFIFIFLPPTIPVEAKWELSLVSNGMRKHRLLLEEVLVRPADGAHPVLFVDHNSPIKRW